MYRRYLTETWFHFPLQVLLYFQTAILLLRIDDIVSGTKKSEGREGTQSGAQPTDASMAE
jgi:hypothetical protein